jgi:hypothetical protein
MNIHEIDRENYERATMWSKHADSRASIILAFNAALVALLVTENPYTHKFSEVIHGHANASWEGAIALGIILFALFIVLFIASSISAFLVLMHDARKTRCEHNTVFSWMNITDISREEYRRQLFGVNDVQTTHAWEDQTYMAAQIARIKMRWLYRAWSTLAGSIFFSVSFIVLTVFFV